MAQAYKDKVQFLSITFDSSEKVEKFLQRHLYQLRHLVGAGSFLKNDLQTNQYPKNIILDEKGTIVHVNSGMPFAPDKETGEMKPVPYTYLSRHLDKILTSN